jgi:hypothetical protein
LGGEVSAGLDRLEAMLAAHEGGESFEDWCCHEIPPTVMDLVPALVAVARAVKEMRGCADDVLTVPDAHRVDFILREADDALDAELAEVLE